MTDAGRMADPDTDILPVSDLEPSPAKRTVPGLWIAIGVLLGVALGAVLLNGSRDREPEERFEAISAAVEKEPFAFEMQLGGAAPGTPTSVRMNLTGVVDPANERSRAEMDLGTLGLGTGGAKLSMISDGTVLYVKAPQGRPLPAGKEWLRVDAASFSPGFQGAPSSTNPLDSFRQLQAVDAEILDLGEETVRGTTTRHFSTRLDFTKLSDQLPEGADATALVGLRDVPVDVWLDDKDRPRRQRMTFDLGQAMPGASFTMTIEAFDFGRVDEIQIPSDDVVVEGDSASLGGLFTPR